MTLKTVALAYVIGGLTFLPILVVSVVTALWLLLPRVDSADDRDGALKDGTAGQETDGTTKKELDELQDASTASSDSGASATFAVLRTYDFLYALAGLNARTGATAGGGGDGSLAAETPGQSESVYQSMYRSVFDRSNKNKEAGDLLAEGIEGSTSGESTSKLRARYTAGKSVFYIVLRHGHLMLYASQAQVEVKHVISLAHYHVGLTEDGETLTGAEQLKESDLFVKRTAIVLTPNHTPSIRRASAPRPYYLFAANCSEKEDFYHGLLAAQTPHPIPHPIHVDRAVKLQSALHSSALTNEARAINAIVGRLFLALHQTSQLRDHVKAKIERKISRVQKPGFIEEVTLSSVDLGDSAPVLTNLKLRDLNVSGDMVISADVRYSGSFQVTIAALAKIDLGLGQRFKARTVSLLLAGILKRLQGQLLIRIKPPPSNRLWISFESAPDMELKIEPVVGVRQISYGFILRVIENKIRETVAETLVKPNWDDVPFFDTYGQDVRGGIWQQTPSAATGAEEDLTDASTKSMPVNGTATTSEEDEFGLTSTPPDEAALAATLAAGRSSSKPARDAKASSVDNLASTSHLRHRPAMSLPPDLRGFDTSTPSRSPKSPSFASASPSAPSVAVDGSSADAIKGEDIPSQGPRKWRTWAQPPARRDAVDAVRDLRDRAAYSFTNTSGSSTPASLETGELSSRRASETGDHHSGAEGDGSMGGVSRASTTLSDANTLVSEGQTAQPTLYQGGHWPDNDTPRQQQPAARSKALLAATAAATNAAKQWYASRNTRTTSSGPNSGPQSNSSSHSLGSRRVSDEPMGRGQPLPPPGTPLPGPDGQKGSWVSGAAGLINIAGRNPKRKPVLPARKPAAAMGGSEKSPTSVTTTETEVSKSSTSSSNEPREDDSIQNDLPEGDGPTDDAHDFGPWRQNSGVEMLDNGDSAEARHENGIDKEVELDKSTEPTSKGISLEDNELNARSSEEVTTPTPMDPTPDTDKRKPPRLPKRPNDYVEPAIQTDTAETDRPSSGNETTPSGLQNGEAGIVEGLDPEHNQDPKASEQTHLPQQQDEKKSAGATTGGSSLPGDEVLSIPAPAPG